MIQYVFHGGKSKMPTRFERVQTPKLIYNSSLTYTDEESLLLLDVQTELSLFTIFTRSCVIEAEGSTIDRLFFSVFSANVLFHSEEELAFFRCNSSTPLNTYVSLSSVDCSAFAFSHIRISLGQEKLTTSFGMLSMLLLRRRG